MEDIAAIWAILLSIGLSLVYPRRGFNPSIDMEYLAGLTFVVAPLFILGLLAGARAISLVFGPGCILAALALSVPLYRLRVRLGQKRSGSESKHEK